MTAESVHARQLRSPARVLLVMDRPLLSEVVKLALNHGPYITRTSEDAAEALAALQEWQPHLAIIDMDGFCCREVGSQREGTAQRRGSWREAAGRAQIARASCGQAVARRSGRQTLSVRVEKPLRKFWTRAWPRVRPSADVSCLKPRIGRSRCLRCPWSRSKPL